MKPQGIHFSLLTYCVFLNSISSNDITSIKLENNCFPSSSLDTQQKLSVIHMNLQNWTQARVLIQGDTFVIQERGSYDYVDLECETMRYQYNECVDDVFLPAFSPNCLHSYGKVMKLRSCDEIMSSRNNPMNIGN